ncbi:MAG: hypothetical protein ABIS21_02475 [Acidimicrobiales bacterium]
MSHMVMFRSAEGKAGYHQTESLDEAIGFVEHLRNQEQVPDARVFRMEEVEIEIKTYYKVEVAPRKVSAPRSAASAPVPPAAPPAAAPAREKVAVATGSQAEEPVEVEPMGATNGGTTGARFGRFNRS